MTSKFDFDVLVLGGGPADMYARAAQLGLNTACVQARGNTRRQLLERRLHSPKGAIERFPSLSRSFPRKLVDLWDRHRKGDALPRCNDIPKDDIVRSLTKGIEFLFKQNKVTLVAAGAEQTVQAETVLIATGRRPNTASLSLDTVGITKDERGFVPVDQLANTSAGGIYAIGDVTHRPMLAHRAEDDGIAVAEGLAGMPGDVNLGVIPAVVYADPEAAKVGLTEEAAKALGQPYRVSTFPMVANSRAKASREIGGFVKIIADEQTDVVLGAHIIASVAGTMIAQIAQAMQFGATSEDIAYTCYAHPSYSEAVKEAALGINGKPIHAQANHLPFRPKRSTLPEIGAGELCMMQKRKSQKANV